MWPCPFPVEPSMGSCLLPASGWPSRLAATAHISSFKGHPPHFLLCSAAMSPCFSLSPAWCLVALRSMKLLAASQQVLQLVLLPCLCSNYLCSPLHCNCHVTLPLSPCLSPLLQGARPSHLESPLTGTVPGAYKPSLGF